MKTWSFFILLFSYCALNGQSVQGNRFSAYILQYGKKVDIKNHALSINRDTFEIVVDAPDRGGVFVHVSFHDSTFVAVRDNRPFNSIPNFQSPAIFEMWRNPLNELLICEKQPQYWFIDSPHKHRFNHYELRNGRYVCTKVISQVYDVDFQTVIPLEMLDAPIYLSFVSFRFSEDNRRAEEIMRHELVINWKD